LSKETLEQVKRPEELLRRKAVLGSTEILTPTCFVILPHKLGDSRDAPENDKGDNTLVCRDLMCIKDQALSLVETDAGDS